MIIPQKNMRVYLCHIKRDQKKHFLEQVQGRLGSMLCCDSLTSVSAR